MMADDLGGRIVSMVTITGEEYNSLRQRLKQAEDTIKEWTSNYVMVKRQHYEELCASDEEIATLTDRLEKWQLNFGHIDPDAARDAALAALQEKSRDAG